MTVPEDAFHSLRRQNENLLANEEKNERANSRYKYVMGHREGSAASYWTKIEHQRKESRDTTRFTKDSHSTKSNLVRIMETLVHEARFFKMIMTKSHQMSKNRE